MSTHIASMTLAFVQSNPKSAARALEQLEPHDVAAFIATLNYKQAAQIIQSMTPQHTVLLCEKMPVKISAAFLSEVDIVYTASVLRSMSLQLKKNILKSLPERNQIDCNILLNFAPTAVGAWMTTHFYTLPVDISVRQALERLAHLKGTLSFDLFYVINTNQEIQGTVSCMQLLQSHLDQSINALCQSTPPIITGQSSLTSIAESAYWETYEHLPVTNRTKKIIGILRHLDLRRGMMDLTSPTSEPTPLASIGDVLDVYGSSLIAFYEAMRNTTSPKGYCRKG